MIMSEAETVESVIAEIEAGLRAGCDPVRAEYERRYLKSDLEFLGASAAMRRLVRAAARARPTLGRTDLVQIAERLWARPIHEYRGTAIEFLIFRGRLLAAPDVDLIERLLRESRTWAYVDALAIHVAAPLIERLPDPGAVLDRWAADADFWIRRAALLSLLPALRRGEGDFNRFGRYADAMLEEKEFFIRKAIGWVLREVSKRDPDRIAAWLTPRAGRASGVTVREAVKYLPEPARTSLLAAYQATRGARRREKAS